MGNSNYGQVSFLGNTVGVLEVDATPEINCNYDLVVNSDGTTTSTCIAGKMTVNGISSEIQCEHACSTKIFDWRSRDTPEGTGDHEWFK